MKLFNLSRGWLINLFILSAIYLSFGRSISMGWILWFYSGMLINLLGSKLLQGTLGSCPWKYTWVCVMLLLRLIFDWSHLILIRLLLLRVSLIRLRSTKYWASCTCKSPLPVEMMMLKGLLWRIATIIIDLSYPTPAHMRSASITWSDLLIGQCSCRSRGILCLENLHIVSMKTLTKHHLILLVLHLDLGLVIAELLKHLPLLLLSQILAEK